MAVTTDAAVAAAHTPVPSGAVVLRPGEGTQITVLGNSLEIKLRAERSPRFSIVESYFDDIAAALKESGGAAPTPDILAPLWARHWSRQQLSGGPIASTERWRSSHPI
jgi:hypothetical protein